MTNDRSTHRKAYDRTRRDFEALPFEDRALFLIEGAASTVAHGILHAGRAAADELDDLFRRTAKRSRPGASRAAEPETGSTQAPPDATPDANDPSDEKT